MRSLKNRFRNGRHSHESLPGGKGMNGCLTLIQKVN